VGVAEVPIRDLKRIPALRAERKRRSRGSGRALGGAFASEWYQSEKISMFSVAEKKTKFHHAAEERKTITRSRG
jgi:hypothetical protein